MHTYGPKAVYSFSRLRREREIWFEILFGVKAYKFENGMRIYTDVQSEGALGLAELIVACDSSLTTVILWIYNKVLIE